MFRNVNFTLLCITNTLKMLYAACPENCLLSKSQTLLSGKLQAFSKEPNTNKTSAGCLKVLTLCPEKPMREVPGQKVSLIFLFEPDGFHYDRSFGYVLRKIYWSLYLQLLIITRIDQQKC